MLIGYARVSKDDQETAVQVAALKAVGCERIYREKASGGRWDRPELHRLLDHIRKGDVLVVWKLDRLSRDAHVGKIGRGDHGDIACSQALARSHQHFARPEIQSSCANIVTGF